MNRSIKRILILFLLIGMFLQPTTTTSAQLDVPPIISVETTLVLIPQEDLTGEVNETGRFNFDAPDSSNYTTRNVHNVSISLTGVSPWLTVYILNTYTGEQEHLISGQMSDAHLVIDTRQFSSVWYWLCILAVDGESTKSRDERLFYPAPVPGGGGGSPDSSYLIATDGDLSTDSITSFSETLADDTLFYPDVFYNDTSYLATSGGAYETVSDDYTYTWSDTLDSYSATTDTANETAYVYVNFTLAVHVEYFTYQIFCSGEGGLTPDEDTDLLIWNYDTNEFSVLNESAPQGITAWRNGTVHNDAYWSDTQICVGINSTDYDEGAGAEVAIAWIQVYYMTLADSAHYAESFSDVSDWGILVGNTPTSDGDIGSFTAENDRVWNIYYWNTPSMVLEGYYIEFRYSHNTTNGDATGIVLKSGDGYTGDSLQVCYLYPNYADTYYTEKYLVTTTTTVESIGFIIRAESPITANFDYFRISPPIESGWSHDGSTTQGVTGGNGGTLSSDGDSLTCIDDGDGANFDFYIDTTATKARLEPDYYQFIELKFSSGNSYFRLDSYDQNDGQATITPYTEQGSTTLYRFNLDAVENDETKFIRLTSYSGYNLVVDYLKVYSIANFTITQSSAGSDDYLYVDATKLYSSIDTGYIEANRDPALSISSGTYPVYNLSTSSTAPEFSQYVSSWSTYSDDTRGAVTSGTLTDIKLKFDSTEILSAIKFIEDGTAPSVVRSFANPPDPDNDESVTLSAVVTDALEVYTVKFNAIVYPAGFSDVDYSASEQSDNLWSYEFSTMTTGHYTFIVIASDGANTNTLTEYAYIDFDVQAADTLVLELELWQTNLLDYHINVDWQTTFGNTTLKAYDNDTLTATGTDEAATLQFSKSTVVGVHILDFKIDGGSSSIWKNDTRYEIAQDQIILSNSHYGEDGNSWSYSAEVNQNVNYYVYDNDTLQESGSKTTGFFSISRDFVNTIGKHIVSIKFNTSSNSEWAGGSYDVDSTLELDSVDPDQDNETVTIGFRVVKSASTSLSYTAYESGILVDSGTITINEGDFFSIAFDKSAVNVEGNATVVFTDGTSSVNHTVIYLTVDQADVTNNVNGGNYIDGDENNYYDNATLVEELEEKIDSLNTAIISIGAIAATGGVIIVALAYLIVRQINIRAILKMRKEGYHL